MIKATTKWHLRVLWEWCTFLAWIFGRKNLERFIW